MNLNSIFFSLIGLLVSQSVYAGRGHSHVITDQADGIQILSQCEGTVRTKLVGDALELKFTGVKLCRDIAIDGFAGQSLDANAWSGKFAGLYRLSVRKGLNLHVVRLRSPDKKTSDTLTLSFYVPFDDRDHEDTRHSDLVHVIDFNLLENVLGDDHDVILKDCGGKARVSIARNQIKVSFSGVKRCSHFDLLSANGTELNFPQRDLTKDSAKKEYVGTFEIPRHLIRQGQNSIRIQLKNLLGYRNEVMLLRFRNF